MKLLITLLFITGCSSSLMMPWNKEKVKPVNLNDYSELNSADYTDHLKSFEKIYRKTNKRKLSRISKKSRKYLNQIIKKIENKNELFFKSNSKAKFYIIESLTPFHFSLPGKKFFFSSSLIESYVKNEAMLYCLIIYELIRSEKNIYNKMVIIPTGTLETKKILSLLRIDSLDKVEVHKWAYYILKRVGIDTDMYLTWLQVKNRNSLDFATQLGDIQSISREEALYKAFVVEYEKHTSKRNTNKYRGSSRKFYAFISDIKR